MNTNANSLPPTRQPTPNSFQWKERVCKLLHRAWCFLRLMPHLLHYGRSMCIYYYHGRIACTERQVTSRFIECLTCEHYIPDAFQKGCGGIAGVCSLCMCCVNGSTNPIVRNKLRMPHERCPAHEPKWQAVIPGYILEQYEQAADVETPVTKQMH